MPDLVSALVAKVQERFADAQTVPVTDYVNRVHRDVCSVVPEIARTVSTINLASGTNKYVTDNDTLEITQVLYVTNATTATKLIRSTLDKQVAENPAWEYDTAAAPTEWLVQGDITSQNGSNLTIYLHPTPNTSTNAGFPVLKVYATRCPTLVLSDDLPGGLASYDVYLEGATYYTAQALRGPDVAAPYYQNYMQQLAYVADRFGQIQSETPENRTYPMKRGK